MSVRKMYKVTRENKKDETFAPQAQAILDTIRSSGGTMERSELKAALEKSGVLSTKQPVARVISFFRPRLMAAGILKEVKDPAVKSEKRSTKPAEAPKRSRAKKTEQPVATA